jgi:hypothetical protein
MRRSRYQVLIRLDHDNLFATSYNLFAPRTRQDRVSFDSLCLILHRHRLLLVRKYADGIFILMLRLKCATGLVSVIATGHACEPSRFHLGNRLHTTKSKHIPYHTKHLA